MFKDFSLCLRVSVAKRPLGHRDTETQRLKPILTLSSSCAVFWPEPADKTDTTRV